MVGVHPGCDKKGFVFQVNFFSGGGGGAKAFMNLSILQKKPPSHFYKWLGWGRGGEGGGFFFNTTVK